MTTKSDKNAFPAASLARDDAALVRKCRKGDESAWNELVDRYQRLVFSIPRRSGLSEAQSADILQEVFLTLFEKLDEIERPEKIRSWLVTTAKFKTWGQVRRDKGIYSPQTEEEMEFEMSNVRDEGALAEDELVQLEEQHLVRTAVRKLDERCQKILSMIYMTEPAASYAEVAEAIGVSATSISPLRSRCLAKLEKLLAKE